MLLEVNRDKSDSAQALHCAHFDAHPLWSSGKKTQKPLL